MDQKFYPRVTSIIGATSDPKKEKALARWRAKLEKIHGVEGAVVERQKILDNGTAFHSSVERFLKREKDTEEHDYFCNVRPLVSLVRQTSEFLIVEERLFCHEHQYQGQPDLICQMEGLTTIVDWTTSQRPKRKKWIEHKFLQAGAYSIACSKDVEQLAVVVVTPKKYQLFTDDPKKWEDAFLERLDAFKKMKTKERFKDK